MHERIVFIHSYLSDKKRKDSAGNPIPDRPTRACTLAAAELYRKQNVDKIAFSVFPELANAIEVRSRNLLSKTLKEEDLISIQSSISTYQEIQAVKNLVEKCKPEKIISICLEPHKERVVSDYEKVFREKYDKDKLTVKTFNEILSSPSGFLPQNIEHRYEGVIKESDTWSEINSFKVQEEFLPRILSTPILGLALEKLSEKHPGAKIRFQGTYLNILGWIYNKTQKTRDSIRRLQRRLKIS